MTDYPEENPIQKLVEAYRLLLPERIPIAKAVEAIRKKYIGTETERMAVLLATKTPYHTGPDAQSDDGYYANMLLCEPNQFVRIWGVVEHLREIHLVSPYAKSIDHDLRYLRQGGEFGFRATHLEVSAMDLLIFLSEISLPYRADRPEGLKIPAAALHRPAAHDMTPYLDIAFADALDDAGPEAFKVPAVPATPAGAVYQWLNLDMPDRKDGKTKWWKPVRRTKAHEGLPGTKTAVVWRGLTLCQTNKADHNKALEESYRAALEQFRLAEASTTKPECRGVKIVDSQ